MLVPAINLNNPQSRASIPTNSTLIRSVNPPPMQGKGVNDMIRVTFSTADFMKLAHLTASSRTNVRVQVPVPIIASATRQAHKIVGLAGRLGMGTFGFFDHC